MKKILDVLIEDDAGDATHPIVGVDAEEQDLVVEEGAPVYPVADEERVGVVTDDGTDPVVTDQGDEQNISVESDGDGDTVINMP